MVEPTGNDYPMSSANSARAAQASQRVLAGVEQIWECIDGPPRPYVQYRQEQGPDDRSEYLKFAPIPMVNGAPPFGHTHLDVLVDWFPDIISQHVLHEASGLAHLNIKLIPIRPDRHRLVWRMRPEFVFKDGRWFLYSRLAFMPKAAWVLDVEEE